MARVLEPMVAFAVLLVPVAAGLALPGPSVESAPHDLTMSEMADRYGAEFPIDPLPEGLSPSATLQYAAFDRDVLGRPPMGWVDWVQSTYGAESRLAAADAPDLTAEALRLYGLLELPVDEALRLDLEAQEARLAPAVRDSFARVVRTVVVAYEAQLPVALDLLARWPADFDIHEPFLSPAQRDLMADRAATIVASIHEFQAATQGLPLAVPSSFSDPEGLIILGSPGPDTYTRSGLLPDPILVVEQGGNDLYLNSAGGANPLGLLPNGNVATGGVLPDGNRLVVSVVADLAGDDTYNWNGGPAVVQGAAAFGGIGLLVDVAGDDDYLARMIRGNQGPLLNGIQYYFDGGGQGYGYGAVGLQIDEAGYDLYQFDVGATSARSIWAFAQGFGAAGGLGVSYDQDGIDTWISRGLGIAAGPSNFQGVYTQGTGFYAGVGIMIDAGEDDDLYHSWDNATTTDYYAQGFGAFGGLGILYEDGGNDDYIAVSVATASFIATSLNCAYGTGSIGGVGFFIDAGGDDRYFGDTVSNRRAHTMNEGFGGIGAAYGFFWDVRGNDEHIIVAHGAQGSQVSGRGLFEGLPSIGNLLGEKNIVGTYLDSGGIDSYIGPGADNSIWLFGADQNLL